MSRNILIFILLFAFAEGLASAQGSGFTSSLLERGSYDPGAGELRIIHDPGIDTLIYRYILYNRRLGGGMDGFRIQIYSSSNKNAREESAKTRAEFMSRFPDIVSYASFERPGYYKIRVGDYRTRVEGTKYLLMVRNVFPDAYLVPDIINFPDQKKN
ncbi:MAG: SPOR domain-containing protein [Bacteroidales bacterium]|jgi:hypothetical protein|nr:SPOR domain-containing protein [Bacteroidales bacterium]